MPRSNASWGQGISILRPSIRISPSQGWREPARIDIRVDLPAPFSPQMATTSPLTAEKLAFFSALVAPKDFVTPESSIRFIAPRPHRR